MKFKFNETQVSLVENLVSDTFQKRTRAHCALIDSLEADSRNNVVNDPIWGGALTFGKAIVKYQQKLIDLTGLEFLFDVLLTKKNFTQPPVNKEATIKIGVSIAVEGFYGREYDHLGFQEGEEGQEYVETRMKGTIRHIVGIMSQDCDTVNINCSTTESHFQHLEGFQMMLPASFCTRMALNGYIEYKNDNGIIVPQLYILCETGLGYGTFWMPVEL